MKRQVSAGYGNKGATSGDARRPITVKRIVKRAGTAHGGAWKIAYADFVTAMMAFFLLMWLVGSTAREDLQGIAEYFKTPLKVALMGGSGSAQLQPYSRDIMREIGKALNDVPNAISISGHTDAKPYVGGEKGYSNWELSADRSNAARRELIAGGLIEDRFRRVVGLLPAGFLISAFRYSINGTNRSKPCPIC